ncbi:MAG: flippase-like domain-containing protein [Symploca sp. SIO1B1]|nr:flippase-like domain-containing protein [Symploca sp. SIO1B1]
MKETKSRKIYFLFIKWLILLVAIFLFLKLAIDNKLTSFAVEVSLSSLCAFLGLLLLGKFLYASRWYFICKSNFGLRHISKIYLFRTNLLAEFTETAMLSSLSGDAVRVAKVASRTTKPTLSATSIILDRLVGLSSVIILATVLSPLISQNLNLQTLVDLNLTKLGLIGCLVCSGIFYICAKFKKKLPTSRILAQSKFKFKTICVIFILSLLANLIVASGYYFLFREFHPILLQQVWAIVFIAQLSNIIPFSFFGVSPSEASLVALASLMGVTQGAALVVVTTVVASKYLFAFCGFLIELSLDGKDFVLNLRKKQLKKR